MPLNRKARRTSITPQQFHSRLQKMDRNGIDYDLLTKTAHGILMGNLRRYGNDPSADHEEALLALCGAYAKLAMGTMKGRIPIALDTGMGKTESIVAFCSALNKLGYRHISVMVCQSKVEGLCELKRKLVDQEGIPAESIGLIHSKRFDPLKLDSYGRLTGDVETFASLPSNDHKGDYQIILVTHNRIRALEDLSHFGRYKGQKRNVCIWDEALIVADVMHIKTTDLRGDILGWTGRTKTIQTTNPVATFLEECLKLIDHELDHQGHGFPARPITLPFLDNDQLQTYRTIIKSHGTRADERETLLTLLDMLEQGACLRAVRTKEGGGVIQYEIKIPPELSRVVVLDASYPIRLLEQYDKAFLSLEEVSTRIKPGLKRYDNVQLKQLIFNSGRHSITKKENLDWVGKEIAEVIKTIPDDEGVLIFTFKARLGKGPDPVALLKETLAKSGIDIEATIQATSNGQLKTLPRINVLTWGMETSLNEYSYCSHVFLAGILRRSLVDLAGAIVGQRDNLVETITNQDLDKVMLSELTHMAFQAFGRGSCRMVGQGYAQSMTGYLIHPSTDIQTELSKVMVGAEWSRWLPKDETTYKGLRTGGIIADLTLKIKAYLTSLPEAVKEVSSRRLKEDLKITEAESFRLARDIALGQLSGWTQGGRSLVRIAEVFN
jgi:hypothetical protein